MGTGDWYLDILGGGTIHLPNELSILEMSLTQSYAHSFNSYPKGHRRKWRYGNELDRVPALKYVTVHRALGHK